MKKKADKSIEEKLKEFLYSDKEYISIKEAKKGLNKKYPEGFRD